MCGNRETEEDLKGETSNGGSVMGNFQERPLFIHGQMNFCFEMVVLKIGNKDCILSAECVCGFCMILKSKRQLFP
jgi:hypothetical protein